jgi:hypothetical protein
MYTVTEFKDFPLQIIFASAKMLLTYLCFFYFMYSCSAAQINIIVNLLTHANSVQCTVSNFPDIMN